MKIISRIVAIIFIIILAISCKDDESLSTQEKLIGKWKTASYTENGVTPDNFIECDLSDTVEYTNTKIIIEDFSIVDGACVMDDNFSFDYNLNGNIMRANNIDTEILELTNTFLKVKSIVNGGNTIKISTFTKIN